jgi:hypothetical protein
VGIGWERARSTPHSRPLPQRPHFTRAYEDDEINELFFFERAEVLDARSLVH